MRDDMEYHIAMNMNEDENIGIEAGDDVHGDGKTLNNGTPRSIPKSPTSLRVSSLSSIASTKEEVPDSDYLKINQSKLEFIEYFPTEFAWLRAWNGISCDSFISTFEHSLLSFITNSKSGMFFFYSLDGKYLLKSLKEDEFVFLRSIFIEYFVYLRANTNSLINRFFGCYGVRHKSKMIHFVVMESIFYSDLNVDAIYDLKGSTKGRMATKKDLKQKVPVLKDQDWKQEDQRIDIGSVRARLYKEQLMKDTEFLRSLGIMDYSLLVGIHRVDALLLKTNRGGYGDRMGRELKVDDINSPHLFTNCHRGMLSVSKKEIYFGGIIDILQRFTNKKKAENILKRIKSKQKEISCVPPDVYAERMVNFLRDYIR